MLSFGAIGFAQPWLLLGLLILPVLWWLARILPPPPQVVPFPALRLLLGLSTNETVSQSTPWWLLALRALIVTLIILALTHPIVNPSADIDAADGVVIVVDNGWSAADGWPERNSTLRRLVAAAQRKNVPVTLLPTAPPPEGGAVAALGPLAPDTLQDYLSKIVPHPWEARYDEVATVLQALISDAGTLNTNRLVYWLPDGVTGDGEDQIPALLRRLGTIEVFDSPQGASVVSVPQVTETGLSFDVQRSRSELAESKTVNIEGLNGLVLAQETIDFAPDERIRTVQVDLPVKLRNEITRIVAVGANAIGSTVVLDRGWHRKSVGVLTRDQDTSERPLLMGQYYVSRALKPIADVTLAKLSDLLAVETRVIVEASGSRFQQSEAEALIPWVEQGGILIRFSSQRLFSEARQDLLPVQLRQGARVLGSTLSWDKPLKISPFETNGIFHGLTIPAEARIQQQMLTQTSSETSDRIWATLEDGTPLVSAVPRGRGWLVLFHISANAEWSNLPVTGLFPKMLERLVDLSDGVSTYEQSDVVYPLKLLNAYGAFAAPTPVAAPINTAELDQLQTSPTATPGLYSDGTRQIAVNLADFQPNIAYTDLYDGLSVQNYRQTQEWDLMGLLLFIALVLMCIECVLLVRAKHRVVRRAQLNPGLVQGLLIFCVGTVAFAALPVHAAQDMSRQDKILAAIYNTHLAYIQTGDPEVDAQSAMGLQGLSDILAMRTAVEPEAPIGLDIDTDELQVWPMLYWPITDQMPRLSEDTISRVNTYLRTGGTVLFDTRDEMKRQAAGAAFSETPNGARLADLLSRLDVPPLKPIPADHVLTRSFYLLDHFPGRYTGGYVWIETGQNAKYDGVTGLVIGSHDWSGAWAVDNFKKHPVPVIPGGEDQREMAYRFGVNLVMYVLTGNYKSDQVHIPHILERLGH